MRRFALLAAFAVTLPATVTAATPPVRVVTLPRTGVVGTAWQVVLRATKAPTVVATGPATLRAKATGKRGVFRATLRFTRAGTWRIAATLGGRTTRLGVVAVDVARQPLLNNPFTVAVVPSGSLLVGQLDRGPLVRVSGGRAAVAASGLGIFHVTTAPSGAAYVAGDDGAVHRLEGNRFVRVTEPMDASSVAVDQAGNLYVALYRGWIKRIAPDGTVATLAGDGTEGYSGDGGPATAAQLFHPHSIALGPDGALYVADTENRRIRRIDLATGRISTLGGDVGLVVSVAVAPDGTVYCADIVRGGAGGGVTSITPQGTATALMRAPDTNGVAVGGDGTLYVTRFEVKRILRLDPRTHAVETVARG